MGRIYFREIVDTTVFSSERKRPSSLQTLQTKYINAHSFISLVQIFNTMKLQQKEHLFNI
jgi:hypothetical protein